MGCLCCIICAMRKLILLVLFVLTISAGCGGKKASDLTKSELLPFTVGEKSTYVIAWKGIPVGRATATIEELTTFKGHEVYKVVVIAKTTAFLSKLFKVEDSFISYMDKDTLLSRHYECTIREGKYKKDLIVDYDLDNLKAIYKNLQDGSVKTCPIKKEIHDPVSGTYFFRTIPLKVGENIEITINQSEENYGIYGSVEKRSKVDLGKFGKRDTFLIKPYLKLKGKKLKRANTWGYVSADNRRLILFVSVKVLEIPWIGEVTATLEKVEYISPSKN